jgi:hypothetical protein
MVKKKGVLKGLARYKYFDIEFENGSLFMMDIGMKFDLLILSAAHFSFTRYFFNEFDFESSNTFKCSSKPL